MSEIVRLVENISGAPALPNAYLLPELIYSTVNILAGTSVAQQLQKSLWKSLKLAIIACFEAYPRLSQSATESITYAIFNAIEALICEKDFILVLNESCKT